MTLNDKILWAIKNDGSWSSNEFNGFNTFEDKEHFTEVNARITANEIEKLIIQEELDLLNDMIDEMIKRGYDDKVVSTRIPCNEVKRLTQRLNELNGS